MDNKIYRIRPLNNYSVDELKNSYLWFSRPNGFKGDFNDANIREFVENTKAIKNGINRTFPKFPYNEWYEEMGKIGICCFTISRPSFYGISRFPGCKRGKGICIEYNKEVLEDFFNNHNSYPLNPCFRQIEYTDKPTRLEMLDDYSILWEKTEYGKWYRTLPEILHSHPRELDKFLFKLLTRIDKKFKRQKEERIILGGRSIPDLNPDLKGYKIYIPTETINRIYVYPLVPQLWKENLQNIEAVKERLVFLR